MNKLEFAFLGSPEIRFNNQPITLPTRKALALLAFVMVERQIHSREYLMTLFWPESDLERAQTSLRTTLAYLRKYVSPLPLVIERDNVFYQPDDSTSIDIDILQSVVRTLAHLPFQQSTQIRPLQVVLPYLRGEFLAGLMMSDSLEFEEWLTIRREAYHQQTIQIFETLSQLQLEAGLFHEGLETTQRWLELASYDESAYQRQMQFHLANGNRIAALQTYKLCCLMLAKEFGLQASDQTSALAQQAQNQTHSSHRIFNTEAECIALNRMATTAAQASYDLDTALNLLRQALSLASQLQNPLHLAETHWNLSHTYFYQGKLETAHRHGTTAVSLARNIGRSDLLGRALNTLGYIKLWSGNSPEEVDEVLHEAISLFENLHQPAMQIDCLTIKANVRLSYGFPDEALQYAAQALKLSEVIQNDWGYASAAYNMGLGLLDAGEIQQAIEICQQGISKARTAGHPPLIFFNTLVLGHIYRDDGHPQNALQLHKEAEQIGATLKSPFFQLLVMTELCADYGSLGQWVEAAQCALAACMVRKSIPYGDYTRWYEIEALIKGDYIVEAAAQIKAMQSQVVQTHRRLQYFCEHALAIQADYEGDVERMRRHLHQAENLTARCCFFTEQKHIHKKLASR